MSPQVPHPDLVEQQTTEHARTAAEALTRPFTPPPLSSWEGASDGKFVPPPVSAWEGPGDKPGTDHLKSEGFLESAWNAIKSPFSAAVDMLTPHSRAEKEAQIQKALGWADRFMAAHRNGTDAEKKAVNDEALVALPFGSTVYKAKEGNVRGALGDVAGMAALGGVAKGAGLATEPVKSAASIARQPEVWRAAVKVVPKGPAVLSLVDTIQKIRAETAAKRTKPQPPLHRVPAWRDNPEPPAASAPDFTPEEPPMGMLPSGRRVGPAPAAEQPPPPPPPRPPLWQGLTQPSEVAPPEFSSSPGSLPSGRVPGSGEPRRSVAQAQQESKGEIAAREAKDKARGDQNHSMNRIAMADRFAAALKNGRMTVAEVRRMEDSHWEMLSQGLKEKLPSAETRQEILRALKAKWDADKPAPSASAAAPAPELPQHLNGRSLSLAQQLEEEMRRSGSLGQ